MAIDNGTIFKLFAKNPLIPAIISDYKTGKTLMLAYMSRESFQKTVDTGYTWFYSRSRKKLWNKGETSGNFQQVVKIIADCDYDTLLIKVRQKGPACHTGHTSCFHNVLWKAEDEYGRE